MCGNYYVSVIDGSKYVLAAGPFTTHEEALATVEPLRNKVLDLDPTGQWFWYAWGTCKVNEAELVKPGRFNSLLAEVK